MKNIDKEKWNNQKLTGKKKFIITYGILLWGVCGSLIYSILTIFFNPNTKNYTTVGIVARIISYAVIFGLVGVVGSIAEWNFKSKKFHKK